MTVAPEFRHDPAFSGIYKSGILGGEREKAQEIYGFVWDLNNR
jgi:hypothetical protein